MLSLTRNNLVLARAESEESGGEFNYTRDTKRELKRARQFRQVRAIVKKEDGEDEDRAREKRGRGRRRQERMIDANYAKDR